MKEAGENDRSGSEDPVELSESPVEFFVHRCKFVDYVHPAVSFLCLDPYSSRRQLGCVRKNGDIELWGHWGNRWYCEKVSGVVLGWD